VRTVARAPWSRAAAVLVIVVGASIVLSAGFLHPVDPPRWVEMLVGLLLLAAGTLLWRRGARGLPVAHQARSTGVLVLIGAAIAIVGVIVDGLPHATLLLAGMVLGVAAAVRIGSPARPAWLILASIGGVTVLYGLVGGVVWLPAAVALLVGAFGTLKSASAHVSGWNSSAHELMQ